MGSGSINLFAREHHHLDALLRDHLLALVGGDLPAAQRALRRWRSALAEHIEIEETRLFPLIPEGARWSDRLYELEHRRIQALALEYAHMVRAIASHPPRSEVAQRASILALLDLAHPMRHVLEHHNQREEMALAEELPAELQAQAWQRLRRHDP